MPTLIAERPQASISDSMEITLEHEVIIEQKDLEYSETPEQLEQHMLVSRALQGDKEAFTDIVDQYSPLMLRTACMIVGDRDIAEDAVQDAFIQAWQHLPMLREARALRPWLMRIVVNQCISFKRRLARSTSFIRQSISEHETDLSTQVADHYKGVMERNWDLAQAIKNLPAKQQAVIILHYYNGMTLPEMAQTLQISENTLKKRIQAALANLRRVLRVMDTDDEQDFRQKSGMIVGKLQLTSLT